MDIPSHHNLPGTSHDLFLQQSHCSFPEKEEKPSKMDHRVQMHMPGTDKPMENFCFDLLIDWLINMSLGTEMQVCCTCSSKLQGTVPSGLFWSSQKKKIVGSCISIHSFPTHHKRLQTHNFQIFTPFFLAKLSYCTRETKADEKMRAKTFTGGHYRCRQTNPLQHLQRWATLGWLILSADENHPQPEKVFTERQ